MRALLYEPQRVPWWRFKAGTPAEGGVAWYAQLIRAHHVFFDEAGARVVSDPVVDVQLGPYEAKREAVDAALAFGEGTVYGPDFDDGSAGRARPHPE
jgi:hypothetical protein